MKIKNIKELIKKFYFINPTAKLRFREIERKLNLPLPSVIRYCKELQINGILTQLQIGDVIFYIANRENETYKIEKKLFNIHSLYESGLINFLKMELSNPLIIVFGSYSKGEDIENSDIDLYIETLSKKEIESQLEKFEKILNRKIQIFRYKKLNEIKNPHLKNNIINGIILNNYIEVFK